MTRAALVVLLASVGLVTCASLPAHLAEPRHVAVGTYPYDPLVLVILSPEAEDSVRAIADRSWNAHTELAGCVSRYSLKVWDSVRVVWLEQVVPSRKVAKADSVTVWPRDATSFCARRQPDYHTHIELEDYDLYHPSPVDTISLRRDGPPFDLLISVPRVGPLRVTLFTVP